jgi:hypothetical protein
MTGLEWLAPSIKAWEIAWMTPLVIGARMSEMMTGGWPPTARDRREYIRMGQEKTDAFTQVLTAVATGRPATSPATRANKTLAPVHRRVKANNRRLSKR